VTNSGTVLTLTNDVLENYNGVVAAGGTGLTVLDNTALLNSSVSSADPTARCLDLAYG